MLSFFGLNHWRYLFYQLSLEIWWISLQNAEWIWVFMKTDQFYLLFSLRFLMNDRDYCNDSRDLFDLRATNNKCDWKTIAIARAMIKARYTNHSVQDNRIRSQKVLSERNSTKITAKPQCSAYGPLISKQIFVAFSKDAPVTQSVNAEHQRIFLVWFPQIGTYL